MPLKIALGGKMGSGKDTSAQYLASKMENVTFVSFAKPIYDILQFAQDKAQIPQGKDRQFLQYIGTEWGRNRNPDIWINILLGSTQEDKNYLCTDIRFPNELNSLKDNGWVCILLRRPELDCGRVGTGSACHQSETELDDIDSGEWHYIIDNNESLTTLYNKLDALPIFGGRVEHDYY